MSGADDQIAGFALGALLDDREQGEPWASAVSEEHAARVRACLREVREAPDKRAAVAELIARVRPVPGDLSMLPPLARMQLGPASDKRGKVALRLEYVPDQDLLTLLRGLAPKLSGELP